MNAADRAYAEARAQGLPERIEDPSALAQVAELLVTAAHRDGGDAHAA